MRLHLILRLGYPNIPKLNTPQPLQQAAELIGSEHSTWKNNVHLSQPFYFIRKLRQEWGNLSRVTSHGMGRPRIQGCQVPVWHFWSTSCHLTWPHRPFLSSVFQRPPRSHLNSLPSLGTCSSEQASDWLPLLSSLTPFWALWLRGGGLLAWAPGRAASAQPWGATVPTRAWPCLELQLWLLQFMLL